MNTWITADTHFSHANIIRYCNRPWQKPSDFYTDEFGKVHWVSYDVAQKNAKEMDNAIITNWNSVVGPNDLVYHLGDYCFGREDYDFDKTFRRLNGKIILIKGNHDKLAARNCRKFLEYHPSGLCETVIEGTNVVLCHYAMRVWNRSHHGAFHLYGHSHGTLPDDPNSLSFDVGVDCNNYFPFSWEQVKARMAKKTFKPIDHHGDKEND